MTDKDPAEGLGVETPGQQQNFSTDEVDHLNEALLHLEIQQSLIATSDDRYEVARSLSVQAVSLIEKYEATSELSVLNAALTLAECANGITPERYAGKPGYLNTLAKLLWTRFERLGKIEDIDQAISCQQDALNLIPEEHDERPLYLANLGITLRNRFNRLGKLIDLDKAIAYQQDAVSLTPDEAAGKPAYFSGIGLSLRRRFERLGQLSDIDRAIACQQNAVDLTPEGHSSRLIYVSNLGASLGIRFERSGEPTDINKAIDHLENAVNLTPKGRADRSGRLNDLGNLLRTRFKRFGELSDIHKAIACQEDAVRLAPEGYAHRPIRLFNLGVSLRNRFEHLGEATDINRAISCQQDAVSLSPEGDAYKQLYLSNLGSSLWARFRRLGELTDIDKAIAFQLDAVKLIPEGDAGKPSCLTMLGNSLGARFDRLNQVLDLDKAIAYQQDAVKLTPESHADKPLYLSNLGIALWTRFERLGELPDIDKAIVCQEDAVRLTPEQHAGRPGRLNNLGNFLRNRFEHLGELRDIDKSIACLQDAVYHTPEKHANKPGRLTSLGISLRVRYNNRGELIDLDKAIACQQNAVNLVPEGHADKHFYLTNLGNSLQGRFQRLGEHTDIDKAIASQQDAVNLTPEGHAFRPRHLNNLGISLKKRFERLGEFTDLNKAIMCHQNAVKLIPEGHAFRPQVLNNLGHVYKIKFERLHDQMDLEGAVGAYRRAAKCQSGTPSTLYNAALFWMRLCSKSNNIETAVEASERLFELIPRVVWLGQKLQRRLETLSEIGDNVNEAAALVISAGRLSLALEYLNEGRSIIWGQLLRLRSPLDDLRLKDEDLANDLERTARALENAGNSEGTTNRGDRQSSTTNFGVEEEAQKHHELARHYESRIEAVRKLDGFEDFLLPKRLDKLKAAAQNGRIVVVNVHESRCDALILHQTGSLSHVRLNKFSYQGAMHMQKTFQSCLVIERLRGRGIGIAKSTSRISGILAHLRSHVVEPVMQTLEVDKLHGCSDVEDSVPRITWCTTGPLNFLPLHAAAAYAQRGSSFEPIVSSYTPSLSALLQQRVIAKAGMPDPSPKILAVSQPYAAGLNPIPATQEEITAVQNFYDVTWLNCKDADVAAVSREMEKHEIVHLACHGKQDSEDPTQSAFILEGGRLTLQNLMKMNLKDAQLAVLSACQTATGDLTRPEEAMHLTAGMLSAGFRSVVGTMWSIEDTDAPIVSEAFYSKLLEFQKDGKSDWRLKTAYALHHAVQVLRDRIGEDEYLRWMPFVHFGI